MPKKRYTVDPFDGIAELQDATSPVSSTLDYARSDADGEYTNDATFGAVLLPLHEDEYGTDSRRSTSWRYTPTRSQKDKEAEDDQYLFTRGLPEGIRNHSKTRFQRKTY